jgi:type I restriction enzyme R subunit
VVAGGQDSWIFHYGIKAWRQIDLSQLNMYKLREEFKKADYKNIEIADLRSFINDKMQQLMQRNVTRIPFAQRLQEIIDRYNAGGAATEDYFNDLMTFMEGLKAEDRKAYQGRVN